jgi:glucose/arabinose dehydrogenase
LHSSDRLKLGGFVISDQQVWGRPVGVVVAQDGSLFVTEDGNGTIWRVTHKRIIARVKLKAKGKRKR